MKTGLSGTVTVDDVSERIPSYIINRMDATGRFEPVISVDVNISCADCIKFMYDLVSFQFKSGKQRVSLFRSSKKN
jgi:hypothetical protein